MSSQLDDETISSGIGGLDDILRGGFPKDCLCLVTGTPGTGKTTLAIQFLLDGVKRGERVLYITLSETKAEIDKVARSHGWDLSNIVTLRPRVGSGAPYPWSKSAMAIMKRPFANSTWTRRASVSVSR